LEAEGVAVCLVKKFKIKKYCHQTVTDFTLPQAKDEVYVVCVMLKCKYGTVGWSGWALTLLLWQQWR